MEQAQGVGRQAVTYGRGRAATPELAETPAAGSSAPAEAPTSGSSTPAAAAAPPAALAAPPAVGSAAPAAAPTPGSSVRAAPPAAPPAAAVPPAPGSAAPAAASTPGTPAPAAPLRRLMCRAYHSRSCGEEGGSRRGEETRGPPPVAPRARDAPRRRLQY
ncbi:unnamed protein product, partial [Closterium sp. NIES-53]